MPNKLKDIFTKEPLERKTRFEFFDEKGYADFIEGLKKHLVVCLPWNLCQMKWLMIF